MQEQTLREKEQSLKTSVAMPTAEDWSLYSGHDALVPMLNQALADVLAQAKAGELQTWGDIGDAIYSRVEEIAQANPGSGVTDSEGAQTIARFFGVNLTPAIYDYLRYYEANRSMH